MNHKKFESIEDFKARRSAYNKTLWAKKKANKEPKSIKNEYPLSPNFIDCVGFKECSVNEFGQVGVNKKEIKLAWGPSFILEEKITFGSNSKDGYYAIWLENTNGVLKKIKVHRLVAFAFIPNPENKPQVNHIDGHKKNNHVSNLEWCTDRENKIHGHQTGLYKTKRGEDNHRAKLSNKQVLEIKAMLLLGRRQKEIASIFGVAANTISLINTKKSRNI
jgi:hypothetical protein